MTRNRMRLRLLLWAGKERKRLHMIVACSRPPSLSASAVARILWPNLVRNSF